MKTLSKAPPGFVFLLKNAPRLLTPLITLNLLGIFVQNQTGIEFIANKWLNFALCVIAFPPLLAFKSAYKSWRNAIEAERLGATMAPRVTSSWPGGLGIDRMKSLVKSIKEGYPGDAIQDLFDEFGNALRVKILFEERIFTCEPDHIKAILATQFDSFEKGRILKSLMDPLLGTGVFNSDDELWKFHRAMTRPFFVKDRISHFDVFDRHAEEAIHHLKKRLQEGYDVDFQDLISRFTLDAATEFLFGTNVNSLSAGLPYPPSSPLARTHNNPTHPANVFAEAFLEAQKITAFKVRFGPAWPMKSFWVDKAKENRAIVDRFIGPVLVEAVRKKKESVEEGQKLEGKDREVKEGESLLDHLVNYTEDYTVLKDEIFNIMIAGRDTTAATLTFAINLLIENPSVLKRLREEILLKVGRHRRPTYEDVKDMKYLRAVLNETLRLYPAVPVNTRASKKSALLPPLTPGGKPIYVPAGMRMAYSVMHMHRRTDLWGPDALEFDPDRFIDERLSKYLTPNPFIFLPFNAGPRICLGQQFAYNEMSFFLTRLLQNFSSMSLSTSPPEQALPPKIWAHARGRQAREKIRPNSHLTMYVKGGLWVRMTEAGDEEVV